MKDYQEWSFSYLGLENGINAITGDTSEAESEFGVLCFDGTAYFTVNGRYYLAHYPKLKWLTEEQKRIVEVYCGYRPEEGEYGVVMGALGVIEEVNKAYYDHIVTELNKY